MVNYQQAKIYKIESNISGKIYIGSTCKKTLAERMSQHRSDYKRYLNGTYHYVSSFDILANNDYDIVLVESYPCDSKDELYSRERYWTKELDCVNKNRNQGLMNELGKDLYFKEYKKEYYDQNKDKILKYREEYYDKNKDKMNEKNNCQCGGFYTNSHKSHHIKTIKHQNYMKSLNNNNIETVI